MIQIIKCPKESSLIGKVLIKVQLRAEIRIRCQGPYQSGTDACVVPRTLKTPEVVELLLPLVPEPQLGRLELALNCPDLVRTLSGPRPYLVRTSVIVVSDANVCPNPEETVEVKRASGNTSKVPAMSCTMS